VDAEPLRRLGEVAEDELGLDEPPVVLQGGGKRAAALLGVQAADEQACRDRAAKQRSGEPEQFVPLRGDQPALDAVTQ